MLRDVYVTRIAKYLPNEPVSNDEMEGVLGMVAGKPSRARRIVLKQNGIETRYYVLNKQGKMTHNNAQLTADAVRALAGNGFSLDDMELLCCGTTSPDQLAPPHAAMVQGELKCHALEVISTAGVCSASMQSLKHGYLSVRAGETHNAVCTGSETSSLALQSKHYEGEIDKLVQLQKTPILAFEKDFLRWMLSDGATAVLLEDRRRDHALKVEWIDAFSFANELETCMFAGCVKSEDGAVRGWKEFSPKENMENAVFTGKQDVRVLDKYVVEYAARAQARSMAKHGLKPSEVDHYLPHLSSAYFRGRLFDALKSHGVDVPLDRWFTNLHKVGNVGSASIFLALEELFNSGTLKSGQKIFLAVPESSRFNYYGTLLTVC